MDVARRRSIAVVLSLVVVVAAVLAVPASSWAAQRDVLAERESELAEVERTNDRLAERLDRLAEPAEIERIARRDYGLVAPGEESYSILPPATAGLTLPGGWPFDRLAGPVERAATGGG